MKILFAASECVPFIKTGGLADVVGALSPVLKAQGADVRVILPLYAAIPEQYVSQMKLECEFEVELCWRRQYCGIKSLEYQGVTFYFVDNQYYFGRSYIYGLGGDEYERFGFFDRAVIDALVHLDFKPDVIHCHDWQTGMIPALLKIQYAQFPFYQDMKTVYTIHNLQYQGVFPIKAVQDTLGLGDDLFTSDKLECYGCANYMKAGLVYADELTTVSPSYADEIQTAFYGERLDGLLRARKDQLVGILNGIDTDEYNPNKDPMIVQNYNVVSQGKRKAVNKAALQEQVGLDIDPDVPLIGMVTRLSSQKGLDLVERVLPEIIRRCCTIKAHYVEIDPTGKKERRLLDFGHTIGGAIERCCRYDDKTITHGEATAIGMYLVTKRAELLGLTTRGLEYVLKSLSLPTETHIAPEILAADMAKSKHVKEGKLQLALMKEIGQGFLKEVTVEELAKYVK